MDEGSGYCGSSGAIECVGCGEDLEYGNDRCYWRGMKSVWRKTVSNNLMVHTIHIDIPRETLTVSTMLAQNIII